MTDNISNYKNDEAYVTFKMALHSTSPKRKIENLDRARTIIVETSICIENDILL